MPGNTERHSTDSAIGFEDLVKRVLSVPVIQRNLPQTQAFVASNGLADPEPFASSGVDIEPADVLPTLLRLKLTDELVQRSLSRLNLDVANDQRRKAIRYVKGGHMDMSTLHLTRVDKDGERFLLCHLSVVASRKAQVYRTRVCLKLNAEGEAVAWLPPPFSQCGCVIHLYVCAHSMAVLCLLAFVVATAVRLSSAKSQLPSLEDVKRNSPEPVLGLAQMPILLRTLFSPRVGKDFRTEKQKLEIEREHEASVGSRRSSANADTDNDNDDAHENEDERAQDDDLGIMGDEMEAELAAFAAGMEEELDRADAARGFSGGDPDVEECDTASIRVVPGSGSRQEPIAMIATISTWEYTAPKVDDEGQLKRTGFMSAARVREDVKQELRLRANVTKFAMPGYNGEHTERQWHALFCEQVLRHMRLGNIPTETVRSHYIATVEVEITNIVDALPIPAGLAVQQTNVSAPGLMWNEIRGCLQGQRIVVGNSQLGVKTEGVTVAAMEDNPRVLLTTYEDNTCSFMIRTPSNARGRTYLHPQQGGEAARWKLLRQECRQHVVVWVRKEARITWQRRSLGVAAAEHPTTPRARRSTTASATAKMVCQEVAQSSSFFFAKQNVYQPRACS